MQSVTAINSSANNTIIIMLQLLRKVADRFIYLRLKGISTLSEKRFMLSPLKVLKFRRGYRKRGKKSYSDKEKYANWRTPNISKPTILQLIMEVNNKMYETI